MSSTYSRKSDRKLIFTHEILDEARRRIENGESQRKVAASLGANELTLRNRLELVSEHY
jgi:SpoVK/Ycf46/Vps4 family AAA+-type ATPase